SPLPERTGLLSQVIPLFHSYDGNYTTKIVISTLDLLTFSCYDMTDQSVISLYDCYLLFAYRSRSGNKSHLAPPPFEEVSMFTLQTRAGTVAYEEHGTGVPLV